MKEKLLLLLILGFMMFFLQACGSKEFNSEDEIIGIKEHSEKYTYIGYYEYSIETYMNADDIIRVCRIDEEILNTMSSEQLSQAVVDYPLINICFMESHTLYDTSGLKKQSDAYAKLVTREDGKNAFISKIKEIEDTADEVLLENLKLIALNEPAFAEILTVDDERYLKGEE